MRHEYLAAILQGLCANQYSWNVPSQEIVKKALAIEQAIPRESKRGKLPGFGKEWDGVKGPDGERS